MMEEEGEEEEEGQVRREDKGGTIASDTCGQESVYIVYYMCVYNALVRSYHHHAVCTI